MQARCILLTCFLVVKVKHILSICISYVEHMLEIIVIVKYSNLLMCFLVVKVKHMLGVCLAGAWRAVGTRSGLEVGCEPGQVSIYY